MTEADINRKYEFLVEGIIEEIVARLRHIDDPLDRHLHLHVANNMESIRRAEFNIADMNQLLNYEEN